jgi:hypothetical protein
MLENQSYVREAMHWIIFGIVVVLVGTGVFLFSEIRHAIVVKELDGSNHPQPEDMLERKRVADSQRPYLSIGAGLGMAIGGFVILATVCTVVSNLLEASAGFRYRGCWQLAALVALVAAAVWSLLLLAACWACVRPYAAGACFLVGAAGAISLSSLDGPSLVLWAVVASAGAFALVRYGGPDWTLDARPESGRKAGEKTSLLP